MMKWRSNNEEFLALLNMSTSKIDYEGKVKGEICRAYLYNYIYIHS
jgi:hypothetical protein